VPDAGELMDLGLATKRCAVTGASRGIGRATAGMLAAEGAAVLLVARGSEALEEAAAECEASAAESGGRVEHLALDVTDPDAGERIVAACEERLGALDVLVNNAGTARWRDLDQVPEADWYEAWELNVMAPLRAMRAAVPGMVERGWGRIVNVASTAAKRPSAQMPEYSVAKAAELSLSRLFADRHAGQGVLVNAICPGPTASELWMDEGGLLDQSKELAGIETRDEALRVAGAKRPLGRLAEVEEIAAAIVFLCSERASYVAGAAWSVDGGTVQVII
jgi:3-oxoacyl-[acyl-carrier protein] reductase